jgi:hypothetical protein
MSRKKFEIDWNKVDEYLIAQCSGSSIASILGCHENTLYDRCRIDKNVEFMTYSAKKKAEGKEVLRKNMFDLAMKGNITMNIFLSKQYLGFTDKTSMNLDFDRMNEDELIFIANEIINKQQQN